MDFKATLKAVEPVFSISLSDLPSLLVEEVAFFIKGTRVVWRSKFGPGSDISDADWLAQHSFALPSHPFLRTNLDYSNSINLQIDRYGGHGLGGNLGSGRAGSIGEVLLKGIGRTTLVVQESDPRHCAGDLNIYDALYELIASHVFDLILPEGTVPVHGLILTGDQAAWPPTTHGGKEPCAGAILVRESRLRPAHFFDQLRFNINEPHAELSEHSYLAQAREAFVEIVRRQLQIDSFILDCLDTFARQMSFCSVLAISHGVISPSNIALDGAWLDLSNVSFVEFGANITQHPQIFSSAEESGAVLSYLIVLADQFRPYCDLQMSNQEFVDFYWRRHESYRRFFFGKIVGIDWCCDINIMKSGNYAFLYERFCSLIHTGNEKIVSTQMVIDDNECWLKFIDMCYMPRSLEAGDRSLSCALVQLFRDISAKERLPPSVIRDVSYIRAAKFAMGRNSFTRGQIFSFASRLADGLNDGSAANKVDRLFEFASDMFHPLESKAISVCSEPESSLHYEFDHGRYRLRTLGSFAYFSSAVEALMLLESSKTSCEIDLRAREIAWKIANAIESFEPLT